MVNLNTSTWYRITYKVNASTLKYYVNVYNTQLGKNVVTGYPCNFHGEALRQEPFYLGDDDEVGSDNYGEAYWDNISVHFVSPPPP
jgi:hypothetical protein